MALSTQGKRVWPTPPKVEHSIAWSFDSLGIAGAPDCHGDSQALYQNMIHPHWTMHQLIADVLGNLVAKTWLRLLARTPKSNSGAVTAGPSQRTRPTLNNQTALDQFRGCARSLTVWSAATLHSAPANVTPLPLRGAAQPRTGFGNFTLFQDVPGKPGWIATEKGSEMVFTQRVGPEPKVSITFLRTYTRAGKVSVFVTSRSIEGSLAAPTKSSHGIPIVRLDGHWIKGFSQGASIILNRRTNTRFASAVRPNSEIEVRFVLEDDKKFKLLEVLSC